MLFRVPLRDGGDVYLLTLLEHQSSVDPTMAARMWIYAARATDRILGQEPASKTIPAVIPVVLCHGAESWSAPTRLADLYVLPRGVAEALRGVAPGLRLLIDDLSQVADDELRRRPGPVLGRCALLA